jgi:hypothetical protein
MPRLAYTGRRKENQMETFNLGDLSQYATSPAVEADDWTPGEIAFLDQPARDVELARLIRKEAQRLKCREYQARKRLAVIERLGGECSKCGETDPDLLQIDEHDKSLSWSPRYQAILDRKVTPELLCVKCNWKKRKRLGEATGRPRCR